ncbi:unnamed protein product [Rotaria socialis]|uniref:F-box domain-containing protein n=2 Tax=Rotaria socialis TaxID=392032 RepID=A0A820ZFQ7_9BILA|nr:unnamed protein product [Rotaria socialis]
MSNYYKATYNMNTPKMKNNELVSSKTRFEDLSNELIYEIFNYLDSWEIYKTLVQLNIRFQHLFRSDIFRLKINLPSLAKRNFFLRCEKLVKPHINRIVSLSLSNHCAIDSFFDLFSIDSFIHLETLILDRVTSNKLLIQLLNSLVLLPHLFTLYITSSTYHLDVNPILQCIFLLPKIQYCKLKCYGDLETTVLPFNHDEKYQCQTLKHLVIDGDFCFNQLTPILTYAPQLTHLSCRFESNFDYKTDEPPLPIPSYLTDINLNCSNVSFDEIEFFLSKTSHHLQRLRLTIHGNNTFLCADRWEQLIMNHMPHLYMFDFMCLIRKYDYPHDCILSDRILDSFKSSFWTNRQWFFRYQYRSSNCGTFEGMFYSTHPYRRKSYELYRCGTYETTINSVSHLTIGIDSVPMDTFIHFPNVTKLTLIKNDIDSNRPLKINLNQIVPLMQLTRLVIRQSIFSISQLIVLLRLSLNIESLTFIGVSFTDEPHSLIRRSDQAFSISNASKVTELRIDDECSLEYVHFFARLCPRVQNLAIVTARRQHESIVRFLLSGHLQHLFFLCLGYLSTAEGEQIERMIDRDSRIFHYTIKNHHTGWYLWWW